MTSYATFEAAPDEAGMVAGVRDPAQVRALLRHAERALASDIPAARSYLLHMLNILDNQMPPPVRASAPAGLAGWQRRKLEDYIETNLGGAMQLSTLSALVRMSAPYFCRVFRQSFGASPGDYIKRRRIARAQEMIRGGGDSLSHIALACGFSDQPHFCRVFRQVTGQTPSFWRSQHRAGKD